MRGTGNALTIGTTARDQAIAAKTPYGPFDQVYTCIDGRSFGFEIIS